MGFVGVTSWPSSARMTVARPVSGPAVPDMKTLGAVPWMEKLKLLLTPAGVWIDMVALPATLNGNCALIWPLETNSSGMGVPLTVRQDSPSAVGSGIWEVAIFTGLISEPYTLMRPPAATAAEPSAALTTLLMTGGAVAAAQLAESNVKPAPVRGI